METTLQGMDLVKKPQWLHKFEIKPECWVFVPNSETVERGREIKNEISSLWKPPYYYAHFKNGGHVAALKRHLGNNLFIRADIKHFFNQVNRSKVTRSLNNLIKNYPVAREIACESTVIKPNGDPGEYILPFGFVQSPIVASLCLCTSALGDYLNLLEGKGFTVSVYMDDIIISTSLPYAAAQEAYVQLGLKAARSNFHLNPDKTIGPVESISVFNINLSKGSMEITKERLTDFENSLIETKNEYVVDGILGYVQTVCPKQASDLVKS